MRGVRDEDDRLLPERLHDALIEDVLGDLRVDGRQRVVQEVHVAVAVHGTTKVHALLLAAAGEAKMDSMFIFLLYYLYF